MSRVTLVRTLVRTSGTGGRKSGAHELMSGLPWLCVYVRGGVCVCVCV